MSAPPVLVTCWQHGFDVPAGWTVVAVDVVRATTTAVTAVEAGHRLFPAATADEGRALAARLPGAVLAGEVAGVMPDGFDVQNSPVAVAALPAPARVVLVSSQGTRLIRAAAGRHRVYAACLRNARAQAAVLAADAAPVALVGAGSRGEFREEDQLCCAWIAAALAGHGHAPADDATVAVVDRWAGLPADAFVPNASTRYLEASGQAADLDFVLAHVDDLDAVYPLAGGEIVREPAAAAVP